jgi:hypothetical protein
MSNEWVMVPREPTANQLVDGAYEVPDPISHRGELTARMVYRAMLDAAPQQAEPVSYAVFDPSGEVVYAALSQTRCIEYRDNEYRYGHSAAKNWTIRPVFAHPPATEVQRMAIDLNRLRVAARAVTDAVYDRERLFAVTELRAALDALEVGE